jgi:hypothetical protein
MHLQSRAEEKPLELSWWIEIITAQPRCIYYFGLFTSFQNAQLSLPGYLEDLNEEGARGIHIQIKHCQPQTLTIFEDELDSMQSIRFSFIGISSVLRSLFRE